MSLLREEIAEQPAVLERLLEAQAGAVGRSPPACDGARRGSR